MRLPILPLVVLAGSLAACRGGTEPQRNAAFPQLPADYVVLTVKHYLTEDGVRRGILNSDTAFFHVDSGRVDLRKVHLLLYNAAGQPAADLVSRTGELDQTTQAMIARGKVVLVSQSGTQRIETEELHYDPRSHRLWSTVSSTITQPGSKVTTDGFEADDQLQNINMGRGRARVQGMKVTF